MSNKDKNFVKELYKNVDALNLDFLDKVLDKDVVFNFSNSHSIQGKENVLKSNSSFFSSIKAMKHAIEDIYKIDNTLICNGSVNYTRHNNSKHMVKFATILKIDNDKIINYKIFADVSNL